MLSESTFAMSAQELSSEVNIVFATREDVRIHAGPFNSLI
jgi:hypothetical protein